MKILGIDIGTTSLSFVLWDRTHQTVLKQYTTANDSTTAGQYPYERVQDPDRIWQTVQQVLSRAEFITEDIAGIGLTGQMHGILYVDMLGNAVSPLYTWQDLSADQFGQDGRTYAAALSEITGCPMASGFGAATYYMHHMTGRIPAQAVSFCTIMDYVGMKLTGRKLPLTDVTNAAGIGLFDLRNLVFDKAAIKHAGLNINLFPEIIKNQEIIGMTTAGIPVTAAIGDNQASFLGAVSAPEKSILVNVGTGSQISFMADHYTQTEAWETRPFINGTYLLVNSPLCGGRSYQLLAEFYRQIIIGFLGYRQTSGNVDVERDDIYSWMNQLLAEHSHSLVKDMNHLEILPDFCGTRKTPETRGCIRGLSTDNFTPEAFAYGMLEGIAMDLFRAFALCDEELKAGKQILTGAGNGIRRNIYLQKIFADIFGLPLELSAHEEEAACGAAIRCGEYLNRES